MSSHDPTMLIIVSEIALFEFVVIITALVIFIMKKRKRSLVLKKISEVVSEKATDREGIIKNSFKSLSPLSEESLSLISREIVREEVNFYQYVIDAFYVNDAQTIEGLPASVEKMVSPYTKLGESDGTAQTQSSETAAESDVPSVEDAIDEFLDDDNLGDDNTDTDIDIDPEFDLSEQGEIAEIPDDLLDDGDHKA